MITPNRCKKCDKPFVTPGFEKDGASVLSKMVIDGDGVKALRPFVRCNGCGTETFVTLKHS